MSCVQTIQDYALRSIGLGERLLPREDYTLCEQFTLIGSGMIWNIYFGLVAILFGFFAATGLAMAKPEPAHAGEQAKQFEQSYCITSSAAERWKGCR